MIDKKSLASNEIKDNLGRTIKLREINGRTRVAFYRALGAKDASNLGVVSEYWNVMAVDSIDGKPCGSIKGLIDLEFIYDELEKSNAPKLIENWLAEKQKEKEFLESCEVQDIKK